MKSTKILPEENNYEQSKNCLSNCEVRIKWSSDFARESKRLKKKYASLAGEIEELVEELRTNPTKGTPIGRSCYKIRLAITALAGEICVRSDFPLMAGLFVFVPGFSGQKTNW